ncbi:MAG: septum formation initiator family protein [Tissierellia bacterium]|nr:septum formation initiator family protein [Tissierellia bacterium]
MKKGLNYNNKEKKNLVSSPLQDRENCSKVKRRTKRKVLSWISVGSSFIIFILLGVLTFHFIQISNLNKEIAYQEQKIEDLKKTKLTFSGTIDGIKGSSTIKSEAKYKLGMVYPQDDQIVYIEVDDEEEDKRVNDNVFLSPVISVLKLFHGE